jgi:hypothetical protein
MGRNYRAAPLSWCRRAINFSVLRNGTFFDGWRAYGRKSHFYCMYIQVELLKPWCSPHLLCSKPSDIDIIKIQEVVNEVKGFVMYDVSEIVCFYVVDV